MKTQGVVLATDDQRSIPLDSYGCGRYVLTRSRPDYPNSSHHFSEREGLCHGAWAAIPSHGNGVKVCKRIHKSLSFEPDGY